MSTPSDSISRKLPLRNNVVAIGVEKFRCAKPASKLDEVIHLRVTYVETRRRVRFEGTHPRQPTDYFRGPADNPAHLGRFSPFCVGNGRCTSALGCVPGAVRGEIQIIDVEAMQETVCECYGTVKSYSRALFAPPT